MSFKTVVVVKYGDKEYFTYEFDGKVWDKVICFLEAGRCIFCNTVYFENDEFCRKCGESLEYRECELCGTITNNPRYCNRCERKVR